MGFNSAFKGLIYLNCMIMHGPANVKSICLLLIIVTYFLTTQHDSNCTLHFDNYAQYNITFSCNTAYTVV